jgi:chemotaxis protein CheY-P-specific phosphatase CheC
MSKLKEIEHDLTRELLSIGLGKAADSLAALTNDKVMLEWFDIHLFDAKDVEEVPTLFTSEICVLTTKVIGDLPGISFLVFSDEDAETITSQSLPPSLLESASKEELEEMQQAVLLELDNIVAASVITQFSNLLNSKIYGGVPQINLLSYQEMSSFMLTSATDFSLMLMAQVKFKGFDKKIQPKFVWFFGEEFISRVKERHADLKDVFLLKNW